ERGLHVRDRQREQAARRIDDGDVDAFRIHRFELDLAGPAALFERPPAGHVLRVLAPAIAPTSIGVPGAAPPGNAVFRQAKIAGVLVETLWPATPEARIDVPLPEIGRLDDVDVAVEDPEVAVCHGPPPRAPRVVPATHLVREKESSQPTWTGDA